jgi:hypothetical protein
MRFNLPKLPVIFFFFCSSMVSAQGELPVNMYTGAPIIGIPIATVGAGGISDQVSLTYNTGGVRVGAESGEFGVNWSLSAGGSISREVRGLPDDFLRSTAPIRKGWLHQNASGVTIAADIATFPNTSNASTACPNTDETSDYNKLQSLNDYSLDSEPDLFTYSVGGYSGKFVFDNSSTPQIRLIPYQDILIEPTFATAPEKTILSFTITTSTGMKYFFNVHSMESRWIPVSGTANDVMVKERNYYRATSSAGAIAYTIAWHLSQAESPSGASINYEYTDKASNTDQPGKIKIKKVGEAGYLELGEYVDHISSTITNLYRVSVPNGISLTCISGLDVVPSIELRDLRSGSAIVKQFNFTYMIGSGKKYLQSVQEVSGDESMPPYEFRYWGSVPASTNGIDLWGYYNGKSENTDLYPQLYIYSSLAPDERVRLDSITGVSADVIIPGADRRVNADLVKTGSLHSISYPSGGSTTIEYEPNDYYDPVAGENYLAGGIRIRSATYMDGTNPDAVITKSFTYKNTTYPSRSSGVLITSPAFTIPLAKVTNNGTTYEPVADFPLSWEYLTARVESDLSSGQGTQGNPVGYQEVKVYRPGAGYAHFIYSMPALPSVTQNKLARPSSCPIGSILDWWGTRVYPYAPQMEYDYERGALLFKYEYDSLGRKVRETQTTYKPLYKLGASAPVEVKGLAFEQYPNTVSWLFGMYTLQTDVAKVVAKEMVITFDVHNPGRNITGTAEYFYDSPTHRFLNRVKTTGADGTILTSKIKYPADYGTIPTNADMASSMIGRLLSTNRGGVPIEQYIQSQKPGGVTKIIGGSITKYSDFGQSNKALPQLSLVWRSTNAIDSSAFIVSSINPSTGVFTPDPSYQVVNTILAYDTLDIPVHAIGENRIDVTTVWSSDLDAPVATVIDAKPGQFAFSDFEAGTEASFTLTENSMDDTPPTRMNPGRSGTYGMFPEVKMSKVLNKADAANFWLSGWWRRSNQSFVIKVQIKNVTQTTSYPLQTYTLPRTTAGDGWDFFKLKIPVPPSETSFYVEITFDLDGTYTTGDIWEIDDIALYPEHSVLTSTTYTFPFGVSSTSMDDRTGHNVYDKLGRVKYVLDRDKNIVQKNTYQFQTN